MKIYIVIGYWSYDTSDPIAVFDTREAADECRQRAKKVYDGSYIEEFELNETWVSK